VGVGGVWAALALKQQKAIGGWRRLSEGVGNIQSDKCKGNAHSPPSPLTSELTTITTKTTTATATINDAHHASSMHFLPNARTLYWQAKFGEQQQQQL
jgi:hypothetical protein